ncbi:hypothetical protein QC763_0065590 [Podospora pseudopauciseta]|uniref:Uncharacterized protein n=1 Tax=Podospora pseudopauciseta TaxID=2093780 RepID=A0ABR0HCE5_9PEZI|nr:hypothetical protein QC763_0065590 [Podospora pseudopauciseta]
MECGVYMSKHPTTSTMAATAHSAMPGFGGPPPNLSFDPYPAHLLDLVEDRVANDNAETTDVNTVMAGPHNIPAKTPTIIRGPDMEPSLIDPNPPTYHSTAELVVDIERRKMHEKRG